MPVTKAHKEWKEYITELRKKSTEVVRETEAQKQDRLAQFKNDYNLMFRYYFPHYCGEVEDLIEHQIGDLTYNIGGTPCAEFHTEVAHNMRDHYFLTQFKIIFRSGAKSVHGNMGYPFWLIFFHKKIKCAAVIGSDEGNAALLLDNIKSEFEDNARIINDFGKQKVDGQWQAAKFKIKDGTLFLAKGLNQKIVGLRNGQYRLDYASVDDTEDLLAARNTELVEERVDRVVSDVKEAFATNRGLLLINNNLRHPNGIIKGLLDRLKDKPNTRITLRTATNITPSPDTILHDLVNDPDVNITYRNGPDGTPTWPERDTIEYWENKKADTTDDYYEQEYMHNPGTKKGKIFNIFLYKPMPKKDWAKTYKKIIGYADLSYKDAGDFKALMIVGYTGKEYHLIDCFVRRTSIKAVAKFIYNFHEAKPDGVNVQWWFEANFAQNQHKRHFTNEGKERGYPIPLKEDKKITGSKYTRIEGIRDHFDENLFYFNETNRYSPDQKEAIRQFQGFRAGSKIEDDAPDATAAAIRLLEQSSGKVRKPKSNGKNKKRRNHRFGINIQNLLNKD